MDEEIDPDGKDVNAVLVEESAELLHILSRQPPAVVTELLRMVPGDAVCPNQWTSDGPERLQAMLDYFRWASTAECSSFLGRMCMLCDDIPMHLESRLMSVAGCSTNDHENVSPAAADQKPLSSPFDMQVKRPKIDYWDLYVAAVKRSLQRRWERLTATQQMLRDVQLEHVWVSPRTASRGRDRPDQTPGAADRGGRTPEPDGDFVCLESRVTLDSFLQESTGKMTVLTGQAGSGKTLLMSHLGQLWANSLGPIPSSYLFVVLEFRQLNLMPHPLSLSELLFQHYPPPEGGDMAKRTIVDYLLSNPEQSCWVLDGYDEFRGKLSRADSHHGLLDLENSLPVADLISGLLNRQILPGSTVLVTCRLRDVVDLDGVSDKVGQLLGWNHQEIREYVDNYFHGKDKVLGKKAADLLFSSRHLLAMSSLPSLCNICCICLDYLLLGGRTQAMKSSGTRETEKGAQIPPVRALTAEKDARAGRSTDRQTDGTNGKDELLQTAAEVPNTLTQIYLTLLSAFLTRCTSEGEQQPSVSRFPQSLFRQHQFKLCELSRLAWKGLEEHKILFLEKEISRDVLEFSIRTGLFTQVELRRQNGTCVKAFSFIHLTVQEFFAALRVMTSNDVNDALLKKRFSLKTRWTTKSVQRTVFTDSLCLFVCGLASPHCTSALVQLARASGEAVVQKRQNFVLNLLKTLCNSSLTGPKVLELCHCVQESQDHQLAKQVMNSRPTLELRNIWLLPNDIDALAFVVNSGGGNGTGLDFGACSMELECLDVLPRCENLHYLSFRSRKYGDEFAEKLSSVLPEFKTLKKLEFCGSSLTAAGAASLASGLQGCPHITEINLSDNNLKNEGIKNVSAVFTHLQSLQSVVLGQNNTSLDALHCLIEKMSSCSNIQHLHAVGKKEIKVTFSENSHKTKHAQSISLLNQKWSNAGMQRFMATLARCPVLSIVDLSGGHWDDNILKTLTEKLSKINITDKIILNDSCTSVKSLFLLTTLLSVCPAVMELRIRLQHSVEVSIVFNKETKKPAKQRPKVLCVSSCELVPADLERLWSSLGRSSGLTMLDVSSNSLGVQGLKMLLDVLPQFNKIQEINAGNNGISMEGVVMLAAALGSHDKLTQTHISDGGTGQVILKFCSDQRANQEQRKTFRINNSTLPPADITTMCSKLIHCQSPLELEFIRCSLSNKAITSLIKLLPKMTSLQKLNVGHSVSITSPADALALIDCITQDQRVTAVDISPQDESFISFDPVKAEEASCRFTHFNLNRDNLKRLLDILKNRPRLSYLDLTSNQMGDEGVKALVDSLQELKISHYVNLSKNGLTQQGMLHVAWTLCACSNVSGVEVSLRADERCLIWFSRTESCEKTLCIRESSLEREHLLRLAEIVSCCPSVEKLELKNNSLQFVWVEELMRLLKTRETEYTVSIEECWIKAEEAVHLLRRCLELNGNIQTVRIQENTLHVSLKSTELSSVCGDSADSHPAQMITRKISLVHCVVDAALQPSMWRIIQSCRFLTELNFSHSSLSAAGTEYLCSFLPLLPNLTTLSLSGHEITDAAAQSLTALFPRLESINLSQCVWYLAGELQLIEALGQCAGLKELCLDSVLLSAEGRTCLSQTLRSISSIRSLKLNKIATGGHSEANAGADLLAAMERLTQIKEIELDGWRISDTGVQQLIRLLPLWKELRKIIVPENLISDRSGEKLLEALKSCKHLQELHLSRNSLGELSAARMALVLPALTHLSVLDISQNSIGSEGVACLSKAVPCMKNLRKIHLTSVGTSELCAVTASLAHCPLIQDVGLGWNGCDDKVALELAGVLPVCHKLTWIDLESNRVTLSGAEALVRALKFCPALQVIRLWKNKISQSEAQMLSLKDRRLNFSST